MSDNYHPIKQEIRPHGLNFSSMPPILTFAADKKVYKEENILFVDDITLANNKIGYYAGWKTISKDILKANLLYPWDRKINKAFWRGKLSDDAKTSFRTVLVNEAQKHPQEFDAKFTLQAPNKNIIGRLYDVMSLYFSIYPYVSQTKQVSYKTLINLDGATCTYPGFLWRLLSNSLTVKQETANEQWFYDAVKPWKHYVPIKKDLSDLIEKIEWIKTNDNEAKKTADQSTEFVKHNLMPKHIDLYIVTLLNEYSKLQKFELKDPTLTKA